ncbi:hypothetical protein SBADM41S_05787 [Streptomyces badius]
MPVHHGRQVTRPLAGDLTYDVLRNRCERNGLVHGEEGQTVVQARLDEIGGDVTELRLAGRETGDPGARQDPHERLGVRRVAAPGEAREDQFAAGEVAAGVAQVGRHDAPDRAVQLVLAAEQPQAQRVGLQQCAQPHLVAADLS